MSDNRPRWRKPDDTSDELEVGDRIVAVCRWSDRQGRATQRHTITLTIGDDGVARSNEDDFLSLEDCDYWMPEAEFLRLFGPEVQQ